MTRFVALGDSLTEGVGDPHPAWPNGLRGWADLLAATLAGTDPASDYANLAVRAKTARDVLDEQVPKAVAMRPDVITIWAGGNDILRPRLALENVLGPIDAAVAQLSASGRTIVVFTGFEISGSPVFAPVRSRVRALNGGLREIAAGRGAVIADVSGREDWADRRFWAADRVHPSPLGHRRLATLVADLAGLGVPSSEGRLPVAPARRWRRAIGEEAQWWLEHAAPHIGRWATGASRRELVMPKWSVPVRPAGRAPWTDGGVERATTATI